MVDKVQQPDEGDDSLDHTEDSGGEQTIVCTADANTLEMVSAMGLPCGIDVLI